ncbi:hypothetical protein C5167_033770 [Papaver somniferum]|uniref:Exostosin GT47 domain-containing protein n=1 Tax=Papaver somniferum TaxID=3469 RepID=A0A4Y7KEZ5_PAPSO|nr:probable glycosyltransferase At5g03795 [Papaver somniferum]RZC70608.1 hypothetical protein C5167_033770 [Papaver somniferum]
MKECSSFCSSMGSSCSSFMLMLVIVPLILISAGFVSVLGPNKAASNSSWFSVSHSPWVRTSTGIYSSSIGTTSSPIATESRDHGLNKKMMDLHYKHQYDHREKALSSQENLASFSHSSPPSVLAKETIQIHKPLGEELKQEGLLKSFTNLSDDHVAIKSKKKVLDSKLQHLESGLAKARASIREASKYRNDQIPDPNLIPVGPMYWNSHAFHRSYLEMEKQFKVFVYEEGDPPLFHSGPCKSIYSMEGNFIHQMDMQGRFRTGDPDKAHVYFLPFSIAMMVRFVYVPNSHDITPIKKAVVDYVNVIGSRYPFWNRSLGADHFMLSCHDWGPMTSRYVPHMFNNSIRALCNANTSEGFRPSKDVSIPEINLRTGDTKGWLGGPSPSHRPILAFFAGGLHGPVRPILLDHWFNKDDDIRVYKYLPKHMSYQDMMKKTKFCICPSGYEVASPRIVEAFYAGCVPVLINDYYALPFGDVLNWRSFSVVVPVNEIPSLKKILTSISQRRYIKMQQRGLKIRRHFEVNSPPERFDVFHMILHSIWLRRLNIQVADQ